MIEVAINTCMLWVLIFVISFALFLLSFDYYGVIGPKRIKNIPSVPSLPIVGNIFDSINNPCLKYIEWSKKYGDVFQIRMGFKIVVVANSFDSIRDLWIKNSVANNSRPELYTFHKVLSKSDVYTIGTTPFGLSFKKKRKYLSTHLHKKSVDNYSNLIKNELSLSVFRIASFCAEDKDLNFFKTIQLFALRISLILTYAYAMDIDHLEKQLAQEIFSVESAIIQLRSHTSNIQDYFPIYRYLSTRKNIEANELRTRRSKYMNNFFEYSINNPSQKCLVNDVMSDPTRDISVEELKSICLTMVSAGLDNIALNFDHCIGHLASSPRIQNTVHREVLNTYGTPLNAWNNCGDDLNCDYVVAVLRETLRYFTVLPLSLPRSTTKTIIYNNAIIPSGTLLFMNAYAGNHDEKYFANSHQFIPERYLDTNLKLLESYNSNNGRIGNSFHEQNWTHGIPSFSFGVGSRMCAGNHLAFKELYILLIKFVVLFEVSKPSDPGFQMELDPIKLNKDPSSIAIEPRDFKIHTEIRDELLFNIVRECESELLASNPYIFRD